MEEQTKRQIVKLRRGGATYNEISNLVGYGLKSIQKVMKECAPELVKMPTVRVSAEKKRAIARDYYENGLTTREVVAKYGLSERTLQNIRNEFCEEFGGKKRTAVRSKFTDEMIAEIKADIDNGLSVRGAYEKWSITGEQLFLYGIINELPKRAKLRELKAK